MALADIVHRNILRFSFVEDIKLKKVIYITRRISADYVPPNSPCVSGDILTSIYDTNWDQEMKFLVLDADIFGVALFRDGATIKTVPMVNTFGAGVHNNFAIIDVFYCLEHCSNDGRKDALYIAGIFLPLV